MQQDKKLTSFPMTAVVVEPPVSLSPRHPQAIWGSEHLQFDLTAEQCLSPSSILNGSTGSLHSIHTPPPHTSPQHFSPEPEACTTSWPFNNTDYPPQDYIGSALQHLYPGEMSPADSGISMYSPGNSPITSDHFGDTASSICSTLPSLCEPTHLPSTSSLVTSCISAPYTSAPIPQPAQQQMVYPPTMSGGYEPLSYDLPTTCSYVPIPGMIPPQFNEMSRESMEPIKILTEDRITGNTIQYYSEQPAPPASVADMQFHPHHQHHPVEPQIPLFPGNFPEFPPQTQSSTRARSQRLRKHKVPTEVDPSEIKDIPASAQLWEFLLKVIKKPKYSYMVSWENQKDGLFRFHDPSAFAALWGRHRNRPSMTYDKVARALRYYYKRDILEQVGGRLTYKFSQRLRKQFMDNNE